MKSFKKYIAENNGLRFVFENLKISSSPGKMFLLNSKFMTNKFDLKVELEYHEYMLQFLHNRLSSSDVNNINLRLHQLNDISNTIKILNSNTVLDDIQLFEIKKFAIISQSIKEILLSKDFNIFELHDLDKVISILDPDNTGETAFYIYSSYDTQLSKLRKKYQELNNTNPKLAESVRHEYIIIEDKIRVDITNKLTEYAEQLQINLERIAHFDVLLAKSILSQEWNLTKPDLSEDNTLYNQLFNPLVKSYLVEQNKDFQAIDISLTQEPILITGANMSGKTVVLRTIALSQLMFQFGFYIPAKKASIKPVDEVILSIGDNQSETSGLSSFAIEILNVNEIIKKAKSGKIILALVDELARTTNPDEGKALVSAFVSIMKKFKTDSVITTHYSGIIADCRRIRVKGLNSDLKDSTISAKNINDFMDYSLIEVDDDRVPMEAIRISKILGVDDEFITLAGNILNKD